MRAPTFLQQRREHRREDPLDSARAKLRALQGTDRDEMAEARRELRNAERAHRRAVTEAERALAAAGEDERPAAEARLAAVRADHAGLDAVVPFFDRLAGITEGEECVLDLAPAVATGHDGVLAVTDRRLVFAGLRHSVRLPLSEVRRIRADGRWFGSRVVVHTAGGEEIVFSGIVPDHAAELVALAERTR